MEMKQEANEMIGSATENRTPILALRGPRPEPLDDSAAEIARTPFLFTNLQEQNPDLVPVSAASHSPCWIWPNARDQDGYGLARVGGTTRRVHRVIWAAFYGPIPDGKQVLHDCDTPACCNLRHLFLGSNADNMADKVAKNRQAMGVRVPTAKLTAAEIPVIRSLYATGAITAAELARRYGVSPRTIFKVVHRQSWKQIASPEVRS